MTKSTVTTERLRQIASGNAFTCTQDDESASMAAELLAVREAQSVPVKLSPEVREFLQSAINDATQCEDGDMDHAFASEIELLLKPLYTAPPAPAPAVPADYQHLKHVSESYFSVEKRLFDLARRLKGPSFDHYAYSLNQAIDVLDKEIFGEGEDNSALLAAAPTPTNKQG